MEQDSSYQTIAEMAFWTGHYPFMLQALAIAIQKCMVWRMKEDGAPVTYLTLFQLAKEQDENNSLPAGSFYMVSREGAIGLCPGVEYMTEWIFVPMEPCDERDRLFEETLEAIKKMEEDTDEQVATHFFCTQCGARLIEGNAFCTECGAKIVD